MQHLLSNKLAPVICQILTTAYPKFSGFLHNAFEFSGREL